MLCQDCRHVTAGCRRDGGRSLKTGGTPHPPTSFVELWNRETVDRAKPITYSHSFTASQSHSFFFGGSVADLSAAADRLFSAASPAWYRTPSSDQHPQQE
jgi:hypothetical protein